MHYPPEESRQLTIIGLIFEGINALIGPLVFVFMLLRFNMFSSSHFPQMMFIFYVMIVFMSAFLLIFPVVFIVNFILFRRLLAGHYHAHKASQLYMYQIIYGIVALISVLALLPGIFYLISGIKGRYEIDGKIL